MLESLVASVTFLAIGRELGVWLEPEDLVSGNRLDVFARTGFVRDRRDGELGNWSRTLYRNFLMTSGVDGRGSENGTRSTLADYFRNFEQLIDSLQSGGFDSEISSIPLSKQGITNGAHRLAIALELGIRVHIKNSDETFSPYDYRWMRRRGLASLFVDAMAFELISHTPRARATIIFGQEKKIVDAIENELLGSAEIIIRKQIQLSEIGKRRSIQLCYDHNSWWKDTHLEKLTAERFPQGESHIDVIFSLETHVDRVRDRKNLLRRILPTGNFDRRIHGSDEYFDTFLLAECLLNQNSIDFLNSSPIGSENRIFSALGGNLMCKNPSTTSRDWCIDGSSTLEIHGLRLAKDLDYVALPNSTQPAELLSIAELHNDSYHSGAVDYSDVIRDPRKHLRFKGIKFVSLAALMQVKFQQKDSKAVVDRQLIINWAQSPLKLYQTADLRVLGRLGQFTFWISSKLNKALLRLPDPIEQKTREIISRVRTRLN